MNKMNKRICDYCGETKLLTVIPLTNRPNDEAIEAELCTKCLEDIEKVAVRPSVSANDGQRFYDRFVEELKKQPETGGHSPQYATPNVLDAARKAAGIDDPIA